MTDLHLCKGRPHTPYEGYGDAIDCCDEREDGTFWVGNGEYGSQVNFCPYCGAKAPKQLDKPTWECWAPVQMPSRPE